MAVYAGRSRRCLTDFFACIVRLAPAVAVSGHVGLAARCWQCALCIAYSGLEPVSGQGIASLSKLPLRFVGIVMLSLAIVFASCSAFVRSAKGPDQTPATEQAGGADH
jgi:hypothetical protein